MNAIQIAYFKHFLYDKDLHRCFQYFYRNNRIKGSTEGDKDGNPESIEQFFLQTSVKDVIMKAFIIFPTNGTRNNSSYDYWKNIDDQWQDYMKANESNFTNDKWPLLKGTFSILRQNWDKDSYWRKVNFESTQEVYERMNINLPLPPFIWEHGEGPMKRGDERQINYDIHQANDGDIVVRVRKFEHGGFGRTIFIIKEVVPYDPETSEFLPNQLHCHYDPEKKNVHIAYLHASYNSMGADFRTTLTEGRQIHAIINDDSEVTKYRLAFDEEIDVLTKQLAEKGLAWNPDKKEVVPLSDAKEEPEPQQEHDDGLEIDFVQIDTKRRYFNGLSKGTISVNTKKGWKIAFNRTDTKEIRKKNVGYAWIGKTKTGDVVIQLNSNDKGAKALYTSDGYYNVNSRQLVTKLREMLSVTDELAYLGIEKISEQMDSITYKIIKQ